MALILPSSNFSLTSFFGGSNFREFLTFGCFTDTNLREFSQFAKIGIRENSYKVSSCNSCWLSVSNEDCTCKEKNWMEKAKFFTFGRENESNKTYSLRRLNIRKWSYMDVWYQLFKEHVCSHKITHYNFSWLNKRGSNPPPLGDKI